jgi:2-methylcitrate dehydratase PrpD
VIKTKASISPLMRKLSAYIAQAPRRKLPVSVTERAKHHVLDTLAAMVSGSQLLPGRRAIAYARALGGTPEAGVIGSRIVTTAVNAALANGMLGHADETDDTHYMAGVHPGCSVVAAALAMAERGRCSGTALLRATVLGYDVCARMAQSLGANRFSSAGHSTHSFGGAFGAAVAAGALAGVDAERARYLLSYAAQQVSGLACWARDTEHVEKAFDFGGMPARDGVTAATMVASHFTGVDDALAGDRGLFHAFGEFARPSRLAQRLGREYEIMNTAIKRWPVGYPIQAPLDALSNLLARHQVNPADIEHIDVTIDERGAYTVNRRRMTSINIQHLMAIMLIDGDITFASSHDETRARDPAVARLKKRIKLSGSAQLSRAKTTQAVVEITTRSHRRLRYHTRAVRGTATNPMSRDEVAAKTRGLLTPLLGTRRAERLIETVWNIERVSDMRRLRPLLHAD